ncbi:MAG: metallophosphoesterase family protein [Prochlorothrix sp.]|nr:metallophosphoesterase [Prochlorothrix sp.]
MALAFRFGVIGDPHVGLPQTIWDHPSRFHLIEVSIPALEEIFERLEAEKVDFLLIPGDLTQHGEVENHQWLADRLAQLPFPVYVVPGNHDVVQRHPEANRIGLQDFPRHYRACGYGPGDRLYYCQQVLPGVRLIGLNSNQFDESGQQFRRGSVDSEQLEWLRQTLAGVGDDLVMVMIHHNVIAHLPAQDQHPLGQRYLLENHGELLDILNPQQVPLIFTGHLHVQDIARRLWAEAPGDRVSGDRAQGDQVQCDQPSIDQPHLGPAASTVHPTDRDPQTIPPHPVAQWEVTTGSLVSYPHPYRICQFEQDDRGNCHLSIQSPRITSVPPKFPDLQALSRQWMGDRSPQFMTRLLTAPPLGLSDAEAAPLLPSLRDFWANIANGNPQFNFSDFPDSIRPFFEQFNDPWAASAPGQQPRSDNDTTLFFSRSVPRSL